MGKGIVRNPSVAHYPRYAGVTGLTPGASARRTICSVDTPAVIVDDDLATHGHAPEEDHAVLDDLQMPPQARDVTL